LRAGTFTTLPLRRQRVQARTRWGVPSTIARTFWRFGLNGRFVTLWAWLIWEPKTVPLSQK
jgi:hypothetical protein